MMDNDALLAARSGYEVVHAARLQVDRGIPIETMVVQSSGRIALVSHVDCNPDSPAQGISSMEDYPSLDEAMQAFEASLAENAAAGAKDAAMVLMLRTRTEDDTGLWVGSRQNGTMLHPSMHDATAFHDPETALEAIAAAHAAGASEVEAVLVMMVLQDLARGTSWDGMTLVRGEDGYLQESGGYGPIGTAERFRFLAAATAFAAYPPFPSVVGLELIKAGDLPLHHGRVQDLVDHPAFAAPVAAAVVP